MLCILSLVNNIYKAISMILVDRLRLIQQQEINSLGNGFTQDHSIHDNFLIAQKSTDTQYLSKMYSKTRRGKSL